MKFNSLTTLGLASVLILTSANSAVVPARANNSVQLLAQATASRAFVTVAPDHATRGTARIVTENGRRYLEFDNQFGTASGPAVEVILYRGRTVPAQIGEADYITLAALKSFRGSQRYALPNSVSLDDFQAVGIWCRKFNVTFGYASL